MIANKALEIIQALKKKIKILNEYFARWPKIEKMSNISSYIFSRAYGINQDEI